MVSLVPIPINPSSPSSPNLHNSAKDTPKFFSIPKLNVSSDKQCENVSLIDLPEFIFSKIIGYLPARSCLSLRRVCRTTLGWTKQQTFNQKSIRKWENMRLSVAGEEDDIRSFANILKINLPITSFHIQNNRSNCELYNSSYCYQFGILYGPITKSITVDKYFMLNSHEEIEFFSKFTNLIELQMNQVILNFPKPSSNCFGRIMPGRSANIQFNIPSEEEKNTVVESITSNLNKLTIKSIETCNKSISIRKGKRHILKLISSSKYLTYLHPPAFLKKVTAWCFPLRDLTRIPRVEVFSDNWLSDLHEVLSDSEGFLVTQQIQNEKKNPLILDMGGFFNKNYTDQAYDLSFQEYFRILQISYEKGILLKNVDARILECVFRTRTREEWANEELLWNTFGLYGNIVSLINSFPVLRIGIPFDQLKKIEIICDPSRLKESRYDDSHVALALPNLETLSITVIENKETYPLTNILGWNEMTEPLLNSRYRSSVRNLTIAFKTDIKVKMAKKDWLSMNIQRVAFIGKNITTNFRGLRSLTISGWNISSYKLFAFYKKFDTLRCLTIEDCPRMDFYGFCCLPDTAYQRQPFFVNPPYFHKYVTKLVLKELDKMRDITESTFTRIICGMALKELWLHGATPLPQITRKALLYLQRNKFGQTHEKFPFHTWTSEHLLEDERLQMAIGFRGSLM